MRGKTKCLVLFINQIAKNKIFNKNKIEINKENKKE